MIRRHAIAVFAVMAVGLMVAAPAEAGGTSGAVGVKKNANVKIKNNTTTQYYVLVLPQSLVGNPKFGTPNTVGWAKKLGACLVNPGGTVVYPVPAGPGAILLQTGTSVPSNPAATLTPIGGGDYTVGKGKTVSKTIVSGTSGPVVQ